MSDNSELIDAIRDLTRVTLAVNGKFATTSEAISKLLSLSIPPNRVADLLGVSPNHVHAAAAKERKRAGARSPTNAKKR